MSLSSSRWFLSVSPAPDGYVIDLLTSHSATMLGGELPALFAEVNENHAPQEEVFRKVWPGVQPYDDPLIQPPVSAADITTWASAANPSPASTKFALGTSHGALVLEVNQGTEVLQSTVNNILGVRFAVDKYPVMAVDWLDEHTVIAGWEDGGVGLWTPGLMRKFDAFNIQAGSTMRGKSSTRI